MRFQIRYGGIEAAKEKAAIAGQAWHAGESMIQTLKRLRVGASGVIFHADQRAAGIIRPAVVGAGEDLLIPPLGQTDRGAAMGTGVEKAADLSGLIAHEHHRLAPNGGRVEIMRAR